MPRALLALLAACGVALPAFAQLSPDKALKSLKTADGLQVELFAAEPMLINPTSIDVDHLGRVWVCEAVNYRRKNFNRPILREAGDRIVILTDKDGDGKADDSTVFYQGKDLYGPLGICVIASPQRKQGYSYRVLVCQSPDILEFWDRDGDGKADGPPTKFLTGFRGFDHDHGVHGINIGPDGKLYFTVGDSGVDGLQSSDGKGPKFKSNNTDIRAGTVWRCDMDGKNLELIAHNFRNNYECCVNSFGEIWLSDNDDDGNQQTRICFVMPGGNYGYHPRGKGESHWHEEQPGIVHKTMRTGFGSPTGICFYEGTLLPKKYHGQLLHTDAGPRELRCFHIKPKGAGYELEKENLVTSTDNWFRLSDVCVAPDGSVIIADWYDPGVGGHGMGDWTRGRIYRVTPKGHKGYQVAEVKFDVKDGVLQALASPCTATRWLGKAYLAALPYRDGLAIAKIARMQMKDPILAARGIFQAGAIGLRFDPNYREGPPDTSTGQWDKGTHDLFEQLRFRMARHVQRLEILGLPSVNDSAALAREYCLHFSSVETEIAKHLIYELAKRYDGQDHFYRAALNIACGTDPKRREAILADFDKHFPEWNDKVADLVWELRPASVLPRLGKLLEDPKLTAAQKGRIVDIFAVNDDPAAGKTMLGLLSRDVAPEIKTRALDNLRTFLPTKWASLSAGQEIRNTIDSLLAKPETRSAGLALIAAGNRGDATDKVRGIAADTKLDLAARKEAVAVLGRLMSESALDALIEFGQPANDLSVACVQAIGQHLPAGGKMTRHGQKALDALQMAIELEKSSPEIKQAALIALAGSRTGTDWLLQQREQNKLPESLVADAGRLLRNSPFQGQRNKALLLFPAPGKLDPKKLPPSSVLAQKVGNAARGEALFKATMKSEAQCMRCHTVRGVGGNIGPDLSMIGKKGSKGNLYDSLLTPSKAIADQYLQWRVNTLDEKSITGLLVAEDDKQITLRDANGKDHTFALKDLDGPKQKSLVSIMPDNLVAALTEDELIDMVEYMMTLKTASLSPDYWYVMGPFIRGGEQPLKHEFGPEEKAFDPKATFPEWNGPSSGPKPKDLGWRTIRPDAKGYIDLMAFHGEAASRSVSFLYRAIESTIDQDAEILIGSDDGCVVWVNGKEVLRENVTRAAAPEQNRVKVKLKKGKNEVLVKIANGNNPHGMYFALTSTEELKLMK